MAFFSDFLPEEIFSEEGSLIFWNLDWIGYSRVWRNIHFQSSWLSAKSRHPSFEYSIQSRVLRSLSGNPPRLWCTSLNPGLWEKLQRLQDSGSLSISSSCKWTLLDRRRPGEISSARIGGRSFLPVLSSSGILVCARSPEVNHRRRFCCDYPPRKKSGSSANPWSIPGL